MKARTGTGASVGLNSGLGGAIGGLVCENMRCGLRGGRGGCVSINTGLGGGGCCVNDSLGGNTGGAGDCECGKEGSRLEIETVL